MNFRIIIDLLILFISFSISTYLKDGHFSNSFNRFADLFLIYVAVYIITSIIQNKYKISYNNGQNRLLFKKHIFSWGFSSLILLSSIYVFELDFPSRFVFLGFLGILLILNIIWIFVILAYKYAVTIIQKDDIEHKKAISSILESDTTYPNRIDYYNDSDEEIIALINNEEGQEFVDFLKLHLENLTGETEYLKATSRFNILRIPYISKNIVNLSSLNDVNKINKYIESISTKLEFSGKLIFHAITNDVRKKQFLKKHLIGFNYILYIVYFLYKRILPKLPYLKRIYLYLSKGKDRAMSHAEVLGRLYSCGFEYVDHKTIGMKTWYVTRKVSIPIKDSNPTYGPLISLNRVGQNGKLIKVYKLRTMHPYSEYIQEFVYKTNDIDSSGKFKDDFRISTLGRFCRKYWLDELPMLINLTKGNMKLVGVRPLSLQYFNLYPEEIQKMRIKYKPGLLPPYYADLPKSFDEIIASEKRYLEQYKEHKFRTDFKYFFLILKNILFKRIRSK